MPRSHSSLRTVDGFTLVELLVVIATIAILVLLLLPAVNSARESVRNTQCSNRLKQIGLALHAYHGAQNELPSGAHFQGDHQSPDRLRRGTVMIRILPYMEHQALYDAFDLTQRITNGQTFPNGEEIATSVVPEFLCPSSGEPTMWTSHDTDSHAISHYAASNGANAVLEFYVYPCDLLEGWNQFALAPFSDNENFSGPFVRSGPAPVEFSEITDGLSNTILFGESLAQCNTHVRKGWAWTNNGQAISSTLIPINFNSCVEYADNGCNDPANWSGAFGFKSRHPNGATFLLGDGSVHFVGELIDAEVYRYLGGKSDGKTVSLP